MNIKCQGSTDGTTGGARERECERAVDGGKGIEDLRWADGVDRAPHPGHCKGTEQVAP